MPFGQDAELQIRLLQLSLTRRSAGREEGLDASASMPGPSFHSQGRAVAAASSEPTMQIRDIATRKSLDDLEIRLKTDQSQFPNLADEADTQVIDGHFPAGPS